MSQYVGKTRLSYTRSWHHLSLSTDSRPLGRLASAIAWTLMGKHKPMYDPSTDCGDYVVATNCAQLHTTGKKMAQKKYYSHTTRPGSLKEMTMEKMMAKWGGGEVLRRAVRGMLPKNRLRDDRMHRLKCFEGEHHPYKQNLVRVGMDAGRPAKFMGKSKEEASQQTAEASSGVIEALRQRQATPPAQQ